MRNILGVGIRPSIMSMFFEDFREGDQFFTEKRTLSKEDIVAFAEQWDYQTFHLDEELALDSPYKGLIASGWHILLVGFSLILDTKKIKESSLGSPGMEDARWLIPVRPNDSLVCRVTVLKVRRSQTHERGVVKILVEIFNQHAELVSDFKAIWLIKLSSSSITRN